jgi:hypothetical protein
MVERGDLITLHEPFCNLVDYGETTVGDRTVRSAEGLIEAIRELSANKPVFFKDTTDYRYPAVLADDRFLAEVRHTFLIRRPAEIAASYYALKPDMCATDLGLEYMYELHRTVRERGHETVVADAEDLARRPAQIVAAYCAAVGLPVRPDTLAWQPGPRPEWEKSDRWHTAASDSSGFTARSTDYAVTTANSPALAAFSDRAEPFYQALRAERLRA